MTKARLKTRGANLPVPQNREEASNHLRSIGELGRELGRHEAAMNDELAAIKERYELAAQPMRDRRDALTEGLKTWCEANRDSLTDNGRVKFAILASGRVLWRLRPPRVSLPKDQEGLLDALRRLGLQRFIRTKDEVSREAMLAEPEAARAVAGVRIASEGEDFVVEPFEADLEGAAA